jgi:hypothetical protein
VGTVHVPVLALSIIRDSETRGILIIFVKLDYPIRCTGTVDLYTHTGLYSAVVACIQRQSYLSSNAFAGMTPTTGEYLG